MMLQGIKTVARSIFLENARLSVLFVPGFCPQSISRATPETTQIHDGQQQEGSALSLSLQPFREIFHSPSKETPPQVLASAAVETSKAMTRHAAQAKRLSSPSLPTSCRVQEPHGEDQVCLVCDRIIHSLHFTPSIFILSTSLQLRVRIHIHLSYSLH
jgi:hypothetical protein